MLGARLAGAAHAETLSGDAEERKIGVNQQLQRGKGRAVEHSPEESVGSSLVALLSKANASSSDRRAAARVGADVAHGRVAREVGIAVGLSGGDGAQASALLVDASETRLAVVKEKKS